MPTAVMILPIIIHVSDEVDCKALFDDNDKFSSISGFVNSAFSHTLLTWLVLDALGGPVQRLAE